MCCDATQETDSVVSIGSDLVVAFLVATVTMVISDDEMQMQPMDVFLSAARRKQPFKSSRTSNQSQSQAISSSSDEKGEEQRYFIITRRLMK
eukprot:scaffold17144_cov94-Skeletonema_dohrnii-CCMP3373.AAC.1